MSSRFVFTPESAHLPAANAAALRKDGAGRFVLAFDESTKESAIWTGVAPQNFSSTNVVAIVNYYMANAAGVTRNVVFDASVEAPTAGSTSVGTGSSFDVVNTSVSPIPTSANTFKQHAITLAAFGSLSAGGYFRFRLERNAATTFDTANNDCCVMAIEFRDAV